MALQKSLSSYLDLVRFAAALTVFAGHLAGTVPGGVVPHWEAITRAPVAIFFVLSGYVITYAATEREKSLNLFIVARAARIYSVALPAIALTMIVDLASVWSGKGSGVPIYQYMHLWKYLPLFLSFSYDAWTFRVSVFTNSPFWSLSYEVWYYVAFAVVFYYSGWRRALLVILIGGFMGIRILVYAPLWVLGSIVYLIHDRAALSQNLARALCAATALLVVIVCSTGISEAADAAGNAMLAGNAVKHLYASQFFLSYYILGSLAALHLYAARFCNFVTLEEAHVASAIAYAGTFTFSIYLTHSPFIELSLLMGYDPTYPRGLIIVVPLLLAAIWIFGLVTERRKLAYRRFFAWLLNAVGDATRRWAPLVDRIAGPQ